MEIGWRQGKKQSGGKAGGFGRCLELLKCFFRSAGCV